MDAITAIANTILRARRPSVGASVLTSRLLPPRRLPRSTFAVLSQVRFYDRGAPSVAPSAIARRTIRSR
jgi:hypothetical protein